MHNEKINQLLDFAISKDASDVHLVVNKPPILRIHGELHPANSTPISTDALKSILLGMLDNIQKEGFARDKELDFSYSKGEDFQFRFNLSMEKGEIAATIRITNTRIPTLDELGLPSVINDLTRRRKGLILLSGTAGSGKSTTLNYMIDRINNERKAKVITIEDPVEYVHKSKQSLIVQREVGRDTNSFGSALKYALRQDPDVVVIGEMRDLESVSMALTTAETGHLVISTVHAPDAVETINRIIDVYPVGMREQIYIQLAENLVGIIGQMLVPGKEGGKRVLATEVLISTLPIRNMIRRGALVEIRGQLDTEGEQTNTYEQCLSDLAKQNMISEQTAKEYSKNLHLLKFDEKEKFGSRRKTTVKAHRDNKDEEEIPEVFQKKKILIVEENQKDVTDMVEALKVIGHEEFCFADKGKFVLDIIAQKKPEIIIIDLGLNDVDSFELCEQIKKFYSHQVDIILITKLLKPTDPDNAKNAGASDFVIKTTAFELLSRSVMRLSMVSAV